MTYSSLNPRILQITDASGTPNEVSHIVPHCPFLLISIRPSHGPAPLTSLTTVGTKTIENKFKLCTTVGTIPKSNNKIVDRVKIDTTNTQIHHPSPFRLSTHTFIKMTGFN